MSVSGATIKAFVRNQIADAQSDYVKDIEALSHQQLASCPSGKARTAYDFTYEIVHVNRRIAMRLRGETPPKEKNEGWMVAPDGFRDKERAKKDVHDTFQEILDAWDAFDENEILTPIKMASGETSGLGLGYMAAHHATYHDAQLNYLQALGGDDEMHWD